MPRELAFNDYFYEYAGKPKDKIITREAYQEIAKKLALHGAFLELVKSGKQPTMGSVSNIIDQNDFQANYIASKRPDIYDAEHSELNSAGFAPEAGGGYAESANIVTEKMKELCSYVCSEEGFKDAIKLEYKMYLKYGCINFSDFFKKLSEDDKEKITYDHLMTMDKEAYKDITRDGLKNTIKCFAPYKAKYDSLPFGTRFKAFFGFGEAAELRKLVKNNYNQLKNVIGSNKVNNLLTNLTDDNLESFSDEYFKNINKDFVVVDSVEEVVNGSKIDLGEEKLDAEVENANVSIDEVDDGILTSHKNLEDSEEQVVNLDELNQSYEEESIDGADI